MESLQAKSANNSQPKPDYVTVADLIRFIHQWRIAIVAPAIIFGAVAAICALVRPPIFQSTAIVDLPLEARPELRRILPTPQAYQLVMDASSLKEEVINAAASQHNMHPDAKVALHTRLTQSGVGPATLDVVAEAPTAEMSQNLVKEWLALFNKTIAEMVDEAKRLNKVEMAVVNVQVSKMRERAAEIEREYAGQLREVIQQYEKQRGEQRLQQEAQVLEEGKATNEAIDKYKLETEKLLQETDFKNSPTALNFQVNALEHACANLQSEQATLKAKTPPLSEEQARQLDASAADCFEKLRAAWTKLHEAQGKRRELEQLRLAGLRKLKEEGAARKAKVKDQFELKLASAEYERDELVKSFSKSKTARLSSVFLFLDAKQRLIDESEAEGARDAAQEARALTRVTMPPDAPAQPLSAGVVKYGALGLVGGLFIGLVLASILETKARIL